MIRNNWNYSLSHNHKQATTNIKFKEEGKRDANAYKITSRRVIEEEAEVFDEKPLRGLPS